MTPAIALTLFLAGLAYVALIVLVVCLFIAAFQDRCDRFCDRVLGPGSSSADEFQLGLMAAMDEASGPPAERRWA